MTMVRTIGVAAAVALVAFLAASNASFAAAKKQDAGAKKQDAATKQDTDFREAHQKGAYYRSTHKKHKTEPKN
jgi:Ni/Co efflux regulator RcnB